MNRVTTTRDTNVFFMHPKAITCVAIAIPLFVPHALVGQISGLPEEVSASPADSALIDDGTKASRILQSFCNPGFQEICNILPNNDAGFETLAFELLSNAMNCSSRATLPMVEKSFCDLLSVLDVNNTMRDATVYCNNPKDPEDLRIKMIRIGTSNTYISENPITLKQYHAVTKIPPDGNGPKCGIRGIECKQFCLTIPIKNGVNIEWSSFELPPCNELDGAKVANVPSGHYEICDAGGQNYELRPSPRNEGEKHIAEKFQEQSKHNRVTFRIIGKMK